MVIRIAWNLGNEMAPVPISEFIIVLLQWHNSWYTKVQLFYERAKRRCFFHYCRVIFDMVHHKSAIYEFPDSVIRPFPLLVCEGSTSALESWKVGAASRFGLNLPPAESIQPENLSPFNVCTQKCRRQRKWTTDENVDKDKQTAYKRVLTLITHLYAVLVSIHRGTIILQQMNIGQAVNFTPSKNIEGIYPLLLSRCLPLYSRFNACSISLRLYRTLPPRT